jgi:hypothetical protein
MIRETRDGESDAARVCEDCEEKGPRIDATATPLPFEDVVASIPDPRPRSAWPYVQHESLLKEQALRTSVNGQSLRDRLQTTAGPGDVVLDLFDPDYRKIDLVDIARALSRIRRYGGNTAVEWTVADHSIACARQALHTIDFGGFDSREQLALACLMHDAAEAYTGDLIWPIKEAMRRAQEKTFVRIESGFSRAIAKAFDLPQGFDEDPYVKQIDQAVCALEMRQLRIMPEGWSPHVEPARDFLFPLGDQAQTAFYTVASELIESARRGGA